jgi:hypothetical protein
MLRRIQEMLVITPRIGGTGGDNTDKGRKGYFKL